MAEWQISNLVTGLFEVCMWVSSNKLELSSCKDNNWETDFWIAFAGVYEH